MLDVCSEHAELSGVYGLVDLRLGDFREPPVDDQVPLATSPFRSFRHLRSYAERDAMVAYAGDVIARGGRVAHVTRHMVGLFQGFPGVRRYRQILSTDATKPGAGPQVIADAFAAVLSARGAAQDAAE